MEFQWRVPADFLVEAHKKSVKISKIMIDFVALGCFIPSVIVTSIFVLLFSFYFHPSDYIDRLYLPYGLLYAKLSHIFAFAIDLSLKYCPIFFCCFSTPWDIKTFFWVLLCCCVLFGDQRNIYLHRLCFFVIFYCNCYAFSNILYDF